MAEYGSEHFLNRETSWLAFNMRVLEEAQDSSNPLLERIKFFCIVSSNLDEFFEVRVAGIKQQIESEVVTRSVDGLTASEIFRAISRQVRRTVRDQYACWRESLLPELERHGFHFLTVARLNKRDLAWVREYYQKQVRPVLTPLAIDPSHPFPQLLNKSLNLIVLVQTTVAGRTVQRRAIVQLPRVLPRLVRLPRKDSRQDYVFLGDLIGFFLADLFRGKKILGYWRFRVTRNSELYIDEEDTGNLLQAVESELHKRRRGVAVRLEVQKGCPNDIREMLLSTLNLDADDLYVINGPLNPVRLITLYEGDHSPELRDPPFVAPVAAALRGKTDVFDTVRNRDILLHHPYESFGSVVGFLETAASDPSVLAIKQTLYRTGGDARIVGALMKAVRNGKQVTVVVELKARFDEEKNIQWARQLEEAGVHVLYGLVGYKIHAKVCLVVRSDSDGIRRYVHLSTGNYNPGTAKTYTDIGLLTCRPDFGEDATNLFNLLTGICQFQGTRGFLVAPFELADRMIGLIEREADHARQGLPARIIAKMNALVDRRIIESLYDAAQAGVRIDLIIRGICCLRPQLKGISENITVRSIVDRFLEHSRIYYFENACQPEVFLASADWMPRNLYRRIEVAFPIEDGTLRERIVSELLAVSLADNVKARFLKADGSYARATVHPDQAPCRSQSEFVARALSPAGPSAAGRPGRYDPVQVAPNPFSRESGSDTH